MELAHDDIGAGPCVVLVHGHPFDRSLWRPQTEALASEFRVVAPDLRGFGASPVTPHLVTLREYAEDVEELLDRLGAERAAVVGLSMGGLVAMDLVTTHPERWWALGLVTTTAEPVTPQERALRRERADRVERDGMQALIDYMHTGLYGTSATPEVRSRVDAMMARASPVGAAPSPCHSDGPPRDAADAQGAPHPWRRPLRRPRRSARSVRRPADRVERRLHHRRGTIDRRSGHGSWARQLDKGTAAANPVLDPARRHRRRRLRHVGMY